MATRFIFLPKSADFPTSNFPALGMDAQGNSFLAFDASTDETCYWAAVAPQGWTGAITAVATYRMTSATTGTIGFQVAVEAITAGDAVDTDSASSFDTVNNSASTTVPGTAGYIGQVSVTLTNHDASAVADRLRFRFNRDADGSAITDSATGDMELLSLEIRDAA